MFIMKHFIFNLIFIILLSLINLNFRIEFLKLSCFSPDWDLALFLGPGFPELGTSLFEIALSLFALERTLILRAMALLEAKSEAL